MATVTAPMATMTRVSLLGVIFRVRGLDVVHMVVCLWSSATGRIQQGGCAVAETWVWLRQSGSVPAIDVVVGTGVSGVGCVAGPSARVLG